MAKRSVSLSNHEDRMLVAIIRKWNDVRRKENKGASEAGTSEVMQHALHGFFDQQFPELVKRRNKAVQAVRVNHKKRFGDPNTMEKMRALTEDAVAAGTLELERFLDELEAGGRGK